MKQTARRDGRSKAAEQAVAVGKPMGRFLLHFAEMCVVMCLGGGLLSIAVFVLVGAVAGYDVTESAPGFSTLVIATNFALAMVAWMRLRGMDWRPTLEMAASSLGAGAVMFVGYRAGVIPGSAMVQGICGPACLAMLAVMALRFGYYANHHARRVRAEDD